jgi:hypothetical protein
MHRYQRDRLGSQSTAVRCTGRRWDGPAATQAPPVQPARGAVPGGRVPAQLPRFPHLPLPLPLELPPLRLRLPLRKLSVRHQLGAPSIALSLRNKRVHRQKGAMHEEMWGGGVVVREGGGGMRQRRGRSAAQPPPTKLAATGASAV